MLQEHNIEFDVAIAEATDMDARIQVRARMPSRSLGDCDIELRGAVTGPFCEHARTLPATIPLRVVGMGDDWVAEAIVVDPCFWTEEMPYLYRVEVDVRVDGEEHHHEQIIGLRRTVHPIG